jgi:hypothetical protein
MASFSFAKPMGLGTTPARNVPNDVSPLQPMVQFNSMKTITEAPSLLKRTRAVDIRARSGSIVLKYIA